MRKYYFISIIFLSLTYQISPQEIKLQQFEYPTLQQIYDLNTPSEGDFLLSTRTRQIWDATSSIWENDSLVEYSYNELNLPDTLLYHKWRNGIVWGNDGGRTYIYNQNNKISVINDYTSSWYNNARYRYLYNGINLYRRVLDFNSGGGSWYEAGRSTYQWNYQNYITMLMHEYRHQQYGWWCCGYKYEYIYDSNNILLGIIEHDGDYCFSWYLYKQKLYTYDANGNNIEYLGQNWNSADSIWINDFLNLYEYNNNNSLIGTIYQNWDTDSLEWKNVWRESYSYTTQNHLKTILKETWSAEFKWENYSYREISYDDFENWIEDVTQLWDSTSWLNYFRYLATWDEPVTVKEDKTIVNNYHLYQNYPNPFNPSTTINYQIPKISFVTIKIYDVLGNEIATLVNEEKPTGSYEVDFDGSELTSGIYFYQLKAGNFVETKKMILMK